MDDKMNIAICDDSMEYINTIEKHLEDINIVCFDYDVFFDGKELVRAYENNTANYDVILLDMEMSQMDGIQTANLIRGLDEHVIIVFITNHTKYMQKSFECEPFRFLVKPVSIEDLKKVFDEITYKLNKERKTLVFSEKRNKIRLFCDNIIYFECQSHWVYIYTKEKTYKICKSMSDLYEKIDNNVFFRIHKSYVINLNYVKEIKENDVVLYETNAIIPISRLYKKEFVNSFMNFKERKYLI